MRHLCHIATTFNLRSGFARRTVAILRESLRSGYRVSLIIGKDNDIEKCDLTGVNIYLLPELVKYIDPIRDIKALLKINNILVRIKPDLVHTHLAKGGIIGRVAARKAKVPIIVHTVHGPTFPAQIGQPKKIVYWFLERCCSIFTHSFVFVGYELQEAYISAGICSYLNSCVIHTGRPDVLFEYNPVTGHSDNTLNCRKMLSGGYINDLLIVTIGRLVPSKQIEHAVEVLVNLLEMGLKARLAIVGDCLLPHERTYRERLKQVVNELEVKEKVIFTGFREDIREIIKAADAVLLTSSYEGLPNIAVESLLWQTPLVTYNVYGVSEIIIHKKTGYIARQNDLKDLVAGLVLCLSDEEMRQALAEKKYRQCLGIFRESTMLSKKMNLYKQIFLSSDLNK